MELAKYLGYFVIINKTIYYRKSGCGYKCAAKGVGHERGEVILNTGCTIVGKICISRSKITKIVIALEKNKVYFIMKILLI